jgi:pimeloyl-ACP methyl ester carboxylesterase
VASLYKSEEGGRLVQERYQAFLKRWPVANQQLRLPTRQGETFVIACGPETAPKLLLFHGGAANSAMWMGDVSEWAAYFRIYAVDMIGEAGFSAPSRPPLRSDAHALWLDDVMNGLAIDRASIVGVSLGGWLALDYATHRPERVESLVLMCPGGVGRQKIGIGLKVVFLRMFGRWGADTAREKILGRAPAGLPPAIQAFVDFIRLIHENFRPRFVKMPVFSDEKLKRLTMPVLAILGGKDVLLDSAGTKRRLERAVVRADVRYFPEAGHFIPGQTATILEFLRGSKPAEVQAVKPPREDHETIPPPRRHDEIASFLRSLDQPDESARQYLEIHIPRIARTLGLVPDPKNSSRVLEMGAYMQMTPALQCVLGYQEVRGAYYGPPGRTDEKRITANGHEIFRCFVDLFDAEKDRYPYEDGRFETVLACEIFEHLLHDPMRMLLEMRRVLAEGGTLVLTTPNVASYTAVARLLENSANPQLFSKYADPRGEYADTEIPHVREYTPRELREAIQSAGFEIENLFTEVIPGYGTEKWVKEFLQRNGFSSEFRGEQIYCIARKRSALPVVRYPKFLYEGV